MKYWTIRWLSYPLVLGGTAASIASAVTYGAPYWPVVPLLALLGIGGIALLERWQPYEPAWLLDHGDTRTDLMHLFVNLTVLYTSIEALSWARTWLAPGSYWPGGWPLWTQLALVIVVMDFGLFLMHWLSHKNRSLWLLHETHHSSERLYWLNGERRHPLHAMMMAAPGLTALLIAGAPPAVISTGLAILSVHLHFQHANLDYSVGPFRHLLGVAETHRWHHKKAYEDAQVNFGELLMIWDHLFRTYRLPPGHVGPGEVGVCDRDAPTSYKGQLLRPFWRRRAGRAASTSY